MGLLDFLKSYDPDCDHEFVRLSEDDETDSLMPPVREPSGVRFDLETDELVLHGTYMEVCQECGAHTFEREEIRRYSLHLAEEDLSSLSP